MHQHEHGRHRESLPHSGAGYPPSSGTVARVFHPGSLAGRGHAPGLAGQFEAQPALGGRMLSQRDKGLIRPDVVFAHHAAPLFDLAIQKIAERRRRAAHRLHAQGREPGCRFRPAEAGFDRRQAASVHPSDADTAEPVFSAAACGRPRLVHPLCAIARWNNPRAGGEVICAHVDPPPADSPNIVTRRRSPPKAPMLPCTQRSAACWSARP